MSDYDNCTDKEIISLLETLNTELVKKGLLHAGEDAVMIQAIKRLKLSQEATNPKEHTFNDGEWVELKRRFRQLYLRDTPSNYDQQLRDYAEHPIQFSIYRKLGLLHSFYGCQYDENRIRCARVSEYVTNPYSNIASDLFKKIGEQAGIDDTWCEKGEKAISRYFGEHLMDIVQPQFRCEKHIGKLKEIAIKI